MTMSIAPDPVKLELKFKRLLGADDRLPSMSHDFEISGVHEHVPFDLFKGHNRMTANFEPFGIAVSHLCSISIPIRFLPELGRVLTLRSIPKL